MYKLAANICKVILKINGAKAKVYDAGNLPKDGALSLRVRIPVILILLI